jgi:hypothetical protein
MMAADALEQLTEHIRQACVSRASLCGAARFDELVRLVVRHWPHRHLEAIERAGGQNHAAVDHAVALVRAQVREQWEARHGVGPLWPLLLRGTADAISSVCLRVWFGDPSMRLVLRGLAVRLATRRD